MSRLSLTQVPPTQLSRPVDAVKIDRSIPPIRWESPRERIALPTSPADTLDWKSVELRHDAFARLALILPDGTIHSEVVPVRAFPTTDPLHWIAFCDSQGHELFLLESLEMLNSATREILEKELARREFQPLIQRVIEARAGSSQTDWRVETERGVVAFATTTEENVRVHGRHGVAITDTHGIRYRIVDQRTLDPVSRRILKRFL